jgi:2-polyprenyl-3-methyl-5-hydroxy-6-metoxy-1,4-benzoquinol methylase
MFTTMFRCASRADLKLRYSALPAPRVLDLGAGGAPWAIAILTANPGATATVNDLPGVLPVAASKAAEYGVADRIDWLPGDFHTVPIDDATYDIVVLGHICRTEGEAGTKRLIERAMAALRPEGTLVLADYFCDIERKLNPHGVLMGATMMASTLHGNAFTAQQYADWIRAAGFESIRLIEPIGFQQQFVATKPRPSEET